MTRTVEVPEGCRAVLVSDQLLAKYEDWTAIEAPEPFARVEARAVISWGELVANIETRYQS